MGTFLTILGMILWILAIIGTALYGMIMLTEAQTLSGAMCGAASAVASILLLAGLFMMATINDHSAMNECLNSGRAWAIVGQHLELVFNAATKTSLPQTVTDYGCVEVRR